MKMRKITKIILHCSATREGQDIRAADIRRWHVEGNGWKDIGYHFVIDLDGRIELGRPIAEVGAHCSGHNTESIGVCYIGGLDRNGKPADTRTDKQMESLCLLLHVLHRTFPDATLHGHNEFANKSCPCFDISPLRSILNS